MIQLLIIEDEEAHVEITKENISKHDYNENIKIYTAKNLTEGKYHIQNGSQINCIFLDLGLPESRGIDTVKEVMKCLENTSQEIPVIIYTGLEDYNIAKEAFSLGVKGFIVKGRSDEKEIERAINLTSYAVLMPSKV